MRWEARLALPALARHACDKALREKMSYRASLCADAPWSGVMRMHCADQFTIDFERECDGGGDTESFKRGRLFVLDYAISCAGEQLVIFIAGKWHRLRVAIRNEPRKADHVQCACGR